MSTGDDMYSKSINQGTDESVLQRMAKRHDNRLQSTPDDSPAPAWLKSSASSGYALPSHYPKFNIDFGTAFKFGLAFGMGMALAGPVLVCLVLLVLGILGVAIF